MAMLFVSYVTLGQTLFTDEDLEAKHYTSVAEALA